MSQSRRSHPIIGVCVCRSEKFDKMLWNRKYRRYANSVEDPGPSRRRNDREGGKDGKFYFGDRLGDPGWDAFMRK